MGRHALPEDASQSKYPWRATIRTLFAFLVGVGPLLPAIVAAADDAGVPGAAGVSAGALAVTGVVTRVLAIPGVNDLLQRSGALAWLAAEPRIG